MENLKIVKDNLINKVEAREILDSKGNPTVEVDVFVQGRAFRASAPSGVSTGDSEAIELRDGGKRYKGKGVLRAVDNINNLIAPEIVGKNPIGQVEIDRLMIDLDNTEQKSKLGANAIVALSMAVCRAGAHVLGLPLYEYVGKLSGNTDFNIPRPQILVMEGGKHGNWATDIQEFMIVPKEESFPSFKEMLRAGSEIFYALAEILNEKDYSLGVGYEGGFCPKEVKSNEEAFELIIEAVKRAGYNMPDDFVLALDAAGSEFFKDGKYILKSGEHKELDPRQWTEKVIEWAKDYPIWSLEDIHNQEDWAEWVYLCSQVGERCQIVGDDLLTTNVKRIERAIDPKAVNAVLIKLNQIGTITETLEAMQLSDSAGFSTIISHRGGETNNDFIADFVVGSTSKQCKFGAPNRGERLAKYNRLLRIEEQLRV